MAEAAPDPEMSIADRGCDARCDPLDVEAGCATPVVPTKGNRTLQIPVGGFIDRPRNRIERGIGRLDKVRSVATRYDKTGTSSLGFVQMTAIRLWLRCFVKTA